MSTEEDYVMVPTFSLKRVWYQREIQKMWCREEGHYWSLDLNADNPDWKPWYPPPQHRRITHIRMTRPAAAPADTPDPAAASRGEAAAKPAAKRRKKAAKPVESSSD